MGFEIRLPIPPGYVSALYFILIDIVILSLADSVIARILSHFYYRSIYFGQVITLKSADIPGVTTYLLDAFWSWPNVIARSIKIFFLVCIFLVEYEIGSDFARSSYVIYTTARYQFNASEEAWGSLPKERDFPSVGFTFDKLRNCYQLYENLDEIRYYSIAFNLEQNATINADGSINAPPGVKISSLPDVLDNSTQCLAPDLVASESVVLSQHVVGCSDLNEPSSCWNELPLEGSIKFGNGPGGKFNLNGIYGEFRSFRNATLVGDWSTYNEPYVFCLEVSMGIPGMIRIFSPCLLTAIVDGGNTLAEIWYFDNSTETYRRRFPGPVFKGLLDIGHAKTIDSLVDTFSFNRSGTRWDTLSGIIYANGNIYKREDKAITVYEKRRTVATLPGYTVILTSILAGLTIVARIIISFTIGSDVRPQLNTINGLSSIAREESQPTGRSLKEGSTLTLGFTSVPNGIRLGPLHNREDAVPRNTNNNKLVH